MNEFGYHCVECGTWNSSDFVCTECGALNDPDESCGKCGHTWCEDCKVLDDEQDDEDLFDDYLLEKPIETKPELWE